MHIQCNVPPHDAFSNALWIPLRIPNALRPPIMHSQCHICCNAFWNALCRSESGRGLQMHHPMHLKCIFVVKESPQCIPECIVAYCNMQQCILKCIVASTKCIVPQCIVGLCISNALRMHCFAMHFHHNALGMHSRMHRGTMHSGSCIPNAFQNA